VERSVSPKGGIGVFVGVHERQLDPKGRLALPAAFRPRLEPRCYLAFGRDKCIDVLTAEAFEQVANEMMEKVRSGEMDRNQQRALAANTIEVTIDGQGRINLEEKLREYAGVVLGAKVVVAGSFDRVEIWEPERHERNISVGTEKIAGADA
jgi:MraZ protein